MNINEDDIARLGRLEILFSDIDGTITTDGRVTRDAYAALWDAAEAGLAVIPVTGRPAGWCDHIARMWPVAAVIGENGGLCFRMTDGGMEKLFAHDAETRGKLRARLDAVKDEILQTVPGCAVASDQPYREYDLAVDYCEDVTPLPRDQVDRIVAIFQQHGATVKVSSIHVNGWFGDFDKLTMAKRVAREFRGIDVERKPEAAAFVGDSPNDEPMFAFFPLSFGVANVRRFLQDLSYHPAFISEHSGGAGFADAVRAILAARQTTQASRS